MKATILSASKNVNGPVSLSPAVFVGRRDAAAHAKQRSRFSLEIFQSNATESNTNVVSTHRLPIPSAIRLHKYIPKFQCILFTLSWYQK
jgi:hypothetical protein